MDQPTLRTCRQCQQTKPLDEYHRDAKAAGGRRATCKTCKNASDFAKWEIRRDGARAARIAKKEQASAGVAKRCRSCGEERPILRFYSDLKSPDGRMARCDECFLADRRRRASMSQSDRAVELNNLASRPEKTCGLCRVTKSRDKFGKRKRSRDGLKSWCKPCESAWQKENYARNREAVLARQQNSYWANLNAQRERGRAKYAANRKEYAAQNRAWVKANPEWNREFQARRRAAIRGSRVEPVDMDMLWTGLCGICGKPLDRTLRWPEPNSPSIDHIIPVSAGGPHVASNLQWAHLNCNVRKGARLDL